MFFKQKDQKISDLRRYLKLVDDYKKTSSFLTKSDYDFLKELTNISGIKIKTICEDTGWSSSTVHRVNHSRDWEHYQELSRENTKLLNSKSYQAIAKNKLGLREKMISQKLRELADLIEGI